MKTITTEDLRRMNGTEGLILQGCGGDLQEWVDGLNEMLTEEKILLDGSRFQSEDVLSFEHDGLTNLLFLFRQAKLDIGRLAMWRLRTHAHLGGKWLSDYVPNRLGGFIEAENSGKLKPDCPLIGEDGNIFNLIGIASRTLRRNGLPDEAEEMSSRIMGGSCRSYDEALYIIGEYVNITSVDGGEDMDGMRFE